MKSGNKRLLSLRNTIRHDNLREVRRADGAFRAIDGIGGYQHLGGVSLGTVTAIVLWNDQYDISMPLLYLPQCRVVRRLLTSKDKVRTGLDAMHQLLGKDTTVIVHDIHHDILHLLIHHPWHHTHDDDGEDEDDLRHERVTAYLQELFLDEVS